MKNLKLFTLFFFTVSFYAQQKIIFSYDDAGNQTIREICISGCTNLGRYASKEKPTKNDLIDSVIDNVKYYPNPIKENLYL